LAVVIPLVGDFKNKTGCDQFFKDVSVYV
jgi:hypothetical protein